MPSHDYQRSDLYGNLRRAEQSLADEIRRLADTGAIAQWFHHYGAWVLDGHYGQRVRCLRSALEQSEGIALRSLQTRLGAIDLSIVWPILKEALHDIALYAGCAVLTGSVIGGSAGAVLGGVGAVPGAISGVAVGLQLGTELLNLLGLKSLAEYLLGSLPQAGEAYQRGAKLAWGHIPQRDIGNGRLILHASDFEHDNGVALAAQEFARGHEIIAIALLAAMVAYLTRSKGQWRNLLTEITQNARLGPKIAGWLEQNGERLRSHPMLQNQKKTGGSASDGRPKGEKASSMPAEETTAPSIDQKSPINIERHRATKKLETYTGDVYSITFIGPVEWKFFYRGDSTLRKYFLSSMAQEKGLLPTKEFLESRTASQFGDMYAEHGIGSQGLPTIGVSDNSIVAEHFARGINQKQNGYITTFRLEARDAENLAIPNYENSQAWFGINPTIGLEEREYLFHLEIDPKYINQQNQVTPK